MRTTKGLSTKGKEKQRPSMGRHTLKNVVLLNNRYEARVLRVLRPTRQNS